MLNSKTIEFLSSDNEEVKIKYILEDEFQDETVFELYINEEYIGKASTERYDYYYAEEFILKDIKDDVTKAKIEDIYENNTDIFIFSYLNIKEEFQGNGYGSLLAEVVLKYLSDVSNESSVTLNASPMGGGSRSVLNLERFYGNIGFEVFQEQLSNTMMIIPKLDEYQTIINKKEVSKINFKQRKENIVSSLDDETEKNHFLAKIK